MSLSSSSSVVPVLLALPPRKFDLYSLSLASCFTLSAVHLVQGRSSKRLVQDGSLMGNVDEWSHESMGQTKEYDALQAATQPADSKSQGENPDSSRSEVSTSSWSTVIPPSTSSWLGADGRARLRTLTPADQGAVPATNLAQTQSQGKTARDTINAFTEKLT